jgi:hypothetical protein
MCYTNTTALCSIIISEVRMPNVLDCIITRKQTPEGLKASTKFEAASLMGISIGVSDYCGFADTWTFIPDYVQYKGENAYVLTDSLRILTNFDEFKKLIMRLTLVDYDPFEEFTCIVVDGVEFNDAHETILESDAVKAIVKSIIVERNKVIFD